MQTKQTQNIAQNKRAFTLIELSIVLVIIGVVLSAIFVTASTAIQNNKRQQLNQEIIIITSNVRNLFSANPITTGFTTASAIAGGTIPQQYVVTGTTTAFKHPFTNGTLAPANGGTIAAAAGSATDLTLTLGTIPREACVDIITNLAGSSDLVNKNKINNIVITGGGTFTFSRAVSPTAANIAAGCTPTGTNANITSVAVTFTP